MRPRRPFYCALLLDSELGSNMNFFWHPPRGLEPDQPWTSFLTWKTLLDSIFSNTCTTHGHKHGCHVRIILPFLTKSRPRRRLYLEPILHNTRENRVSKTKEIKIIVRRNVTMFPIGEYVILHRKFSEHVSIMSGWHKMFGNTILQKISTKKRQCRNRWQEPMMLPFLEIKRFI
jgi:hypothetical protein